MWTEGVYFFAFDQGSSGDGDPLAAGAQVAPSFFVIGAVRVPTTLDTGCWSKEARNACCGE